jgi:hypothetical protein
MKRSRMALTGGFPWLGPAGACHYNKGAQAHTERTPVCSLLSSRLRRCYGLTGEFADLAPNERTAQRGSLGSECAYGHHLTGAFIRLQA